MKNSEKFKTAKARERAFKEFCKKNRCTGNCPVIQKILSYKQPNVRCEFVWLELEAKEKQDER